MRGHDINKRIVIASCLSLWRLFSKKGKRKATYEITLTLLDFYKINEIELWWNEKCPGPVLEAGIHPCSSPGGLIVYQLSGSALLAPAQYVIRLTPINPFQSNPIWLYLPPRCVHINGHLQHKKSMFKSQKGFFLGAISKKLSVKIFCRFDSSWN